eukprot:gene16974-biopygen17300
MRLDGTKPQNKPSPSKSPLPSPGPSCGPLQIRPLHGPLGRRRDRRTVAVTMLWAEMCCGHVAGPDGEHNPDPKPVACGPQRVILYY